MKLCKRRKSTS